MADSTISYERCIETAGIALASGDRASAERALRAAIQTIESVEGAQLELVSVLSQLGALKHDMGSYDEAEEVFRRALNISERVIGPDDVRLVSALTGLGAARIMRGAPEEAEPVITRALAIAEKNLGADHPDLVILLNDLTRLYLKQSAHAFAEPLLQRLLAAKRSKGEDHPEVATVLASLATVRQALGRYEAAEQLWRRVLSIRERTLAPNHFSLATAFEHLAETCAARGKVSEALQLFQRALTIRELSLGADHASLRTSRERIADLQLQASEDSLEVGDAPASIPEIRRLSSGEHLGVGLNGSAPVPQRFVPPTPSRERGMSAPPASPRERGISAPARERSAPPTSFAPAREKSFNVPVREKITVRQAREAALITETELVPTTLEEKVVTPPVATQAPVVETAATSAAPAEPTSAPDPLPYLNALLDIKDELDETPEAAQPKRRVAAMLATTGLFFRERRSAVMVGAGALTLTLVIVAAAGAARSGKPTWIDQATVAEAPPRRDSATVTLAGLAETARPQTDVAKDSAAANAAKAVPVRSRETSSSKKATESDGETPTIALPSMPRTPLVRLDSIARTSNVSARPSNDSLQVQLSAMVDNTKKAASATSVGAPVRSRVIGSLPTPQYPQQLLRASVGGEVRVRFDVDTLGRPVMSTFVVVGSPDAQLSAAVRRVIPDIRFEPARTPWPEYRPIVDRVEIGFQFNPKLR